MFEYCCYINSASMYVQDRVTRVGKTNKDKFLKISLGLTYNHRY